MPILVVPPGAESAPISHGERSFQPFLEDPRDPRSLWLADIPDEPAVHFRHTGGFSLYHPHPATRLLSGATLPIVHDDGATSCSWDGQEYLPDGKGVFTVPAEAFGELKEGHGFRLNEKASDEPDEAVDLPQSKSKGKVKRGAPEQRIDGGLPPWEADPPGTPHPDVPITSA